MNRNLRIFRETLSDELARTLLGGSSAVNDLTHWYRLQEAQHALRAAAEAAALVLAASPLMRIVADYAMRQAGKRGFPQIVVDPDGSIMLEVHYDTPEEERAGQPEEVGRKSILPTILALRAEAEELGIDHSPFGKNKTRLLATIEKARQGGTKASPPPVVASPPPVVPEPAKPKMMRTAPALSPVRVVQPDSIVAIPDDDDDDLNSLFGTPVAAPVAAPEVPAVHLPRRGVPLAVVAPAAPASSAKLGGRSLSDLASKAPDEVDIDALLAKGAPASPPKD